MRPEIQIFSRKPKFDTAFCGRLCGFVPAAVDPAREALLSDSRTPEFANPRMELAAFCTLTGISFPELETWQVEARRDYRGETSGPHERDEWDDECWEDEDGWDEGGEGDDASDADPGSDDSLLPGRGQDDKGPAEQFGPITNAGPRIGRNDPCPCGSGKKYKKCCLRK